jgi:hypothetical protein
MEASGVTFSSRPSATIASCGLSRVDAARQCEHAERDPHRNFKTLNAVA